MKFFGAFNNVSSGASRFLLQYDILMSAIVSVGENITY